ncbi:MAG: hypothetical protein AAFU85_18465 [Planctomycetota bacterium]
METRKYLTCLWPGLNELWWRGRLSALPSAIGFALLLNGLLILRYHYPYWLSPFLVRSAGWIAFVSWLVWTVRSFRELPELLTPRQVSDEPDRFDDAHSAYLRGEWKNAESLLLGILAIEPRDPPALLLLSGVYRQTRRVESAAALVGELRRLEVGTDWIVEIDAELRRIARDSERGSEDDNDKQTTAGSIHPGPAADLTAA